ncbi:MAG: hypothetical protein K9W46_03180 [Candidatus Heimdallarchaeum endolithica]|uniref:Uncharacterized protein n=1 Tax=Candidatus Heimdallarchaeum endolithica TaxID=2876572 RepID=A0A9Y1BSD8_9ARCH|nr:MAG: hypothetical protein K9W46_03180 [Candidatus Heimdallarchaeum endolithica]
MKSIIGFIFENPVKKNPSLKKEIKTVAPYLYYEDKWFGFLKDHLIYLDDKKKQIYLRKIKILPFNAGGSTAYITKIELNW